MYFSLFVRNTARVTLPQNSLRDFIIQNTAENYVLVPNSDFQPNFNECLKLHLEKGSISPHVFHITMKLLLLF